MTNSKKVFLGASLLFLAGLAYLSYDISSRTTFPGSKPQLKERIQKQFLEADTTQLDSAKAIHRQ
ncbi:MAG: hypothetical protein RLN86_04840 [Cyclobacteriaceae bacterium]